jgi:hypothetical protein
MKMRSLRWNLVVWTPSAGPADPFGAPRFTRMAWAVRARWRPIFLATGVLLMVLGLMLPSAVAFVAGILVVGLSAPDTGPHSLATAMVRAWTPPHKGRDGHL